ncbi:hypothetical protein BGZ61DRAFT_575905 [Ilyonectria robusta]|uniref:uncharacterized protein n=1 Tax=Ilyonectria robusta TaxID=1079257 RepID=UPI001E8EAEBC|nr:uncharacterized protein BGZ61DRAFT_575905 [Ilyonectria robusta]KAH8706288.1 hypothetical protein BGZ61DRAFT_575905 [Ilyonectria robusta]
MPESQTRPFGPYKTLMLGIDDNGPENSTASGHFLPILLIIPQKNSQGRGSIRRIAAVNHAHTLAWCATRRGALPKEARDASQATMLLTSRYLPNGATRQTGMCTRAGVRGRRGDPPLPGELKAHTGQTMETGWKPGACEAALMKQSGDRARNHLPGNRKFTISDSPVNQAWSQTSIPGV